MTREFVYTSKFDKEWAKLGLTDDNLVVLEKYLVENPNAGKIMMGTDGIRKLRWVLPNKGKSGGVRVLYIDFIFQEKIVMFSVFSKEETGNLTQAQKNSLKELVKQMGEELKK